MKSEQSEASQATKDRATLEVFRSSLFVRVQILNLSRKAEPWNNSADEMVSAARKRAAAAQKAKRPARKESVASSSQDNDAFEQTEVGYVTLRGKQTHVVEAPLPSAWPYPELTTRTHISAKGDEEDLVGHWVTPRGQKIWQGLAMIFEEEALFSEIDPCAEYAQPKHPLHELWKKYNSGRPTEYKPTTIPLNLLPEQQTKVADKDAENGITYVDPTANALEENVEGTKRHTYGTTEGGYWRRGLCKNGDASRFLHPPKKAPKLIPSDVCRFRTKGQCTKGNAYGWKHPSEWAARR